MQIRNSDDASAWAPASDEYFNHFQHGVYDEENYLQLILPVDDLRVDSEKGDLVVGNAGVDGIYFCFRKGRRGVWAYYGIEDEHILMTSTLAELVSSWKDGSLVL